jgi:hypothetical protein
MPGTDNRCFVYRGGDHAINPAREAQRSGFAEPGYSGVGGWNSTGVKPFR